MLQSEFSRQFPNAHIFIDLDSIEPGYEFGKVIQEAIDSCAVLVALIGRQWVTMRDKKRHRRLDNPDDYVRFEVRTALDRGVRVIPVLVDGAEPLRQQQLPSDLQRLARIHAHKLSYDRYQEDAAELVEVIQRALTAPPGASTVHEEQAQPTSGPTGRVTGQGRWSCELVKVGFNYEKYRLSSDEEVHEIRLMDWPTHATIHADRKLEVFKYELDGEYLLSKLSWAVGTAVTIRVKARWGKKRSITLKVGEQVFSYDWGSGPA